MRIVLQRVDRASVTVDGSLVGEIGAGLLLLVGVAAGDDGPTARRLANKVAELRVFADAEERFSRSLVDTGHAALVVSQFTLLADVRKGRRPSFAEAAAGDVASPIIDAFCEALRQLGVTVATGVFGAAMSVSLVNNGPVTIVLDSSDLEGPRRR